MAFLSSYALKTELLGSGALRPFLSSYAIKTELLGSGALRPFLSSYAIKTELLGSEALRPFLSSYALKTELLGSRATWLRGSLAFLSGYALKTKLLGSGALRPFHLPFLGKARVALMRIYGELGWIVRLPKCPGFLINSGPSVVVLCFPNFVLSLAESESTHDGASGFGHHCMGFVR